MTSATLAMDQPPWGMTTPAAAQMIITTVLAVVTGGLRRRSVGQLVSHQAPPDSASAEHN
jgi:hypothetical protein